jgi:hypothetical protein
VRDLSLHVLDVMENSLHVKATIIAVTVDVDEAKDRLRIAVEDDGPGFPAPVERVADPFFTTKSGKKTGLGLSLFRQAAERAGGKLVLGRSELGGASVLAEMQLSHVDRSPMGDLASTFASVICTSPGVDVRICLSRPGRTIRIESQRIRRELPEKSRSSAAVAKKVSQLISAGAGELWPQPTL